MLATAKANLESILYFGISEQYENSVLLLEHTLRYKGLCFPWEAPKEGHLVEAKLGARSLTDGRFIINETKEKDECLDGLMQPQESTGGEEEEDEIDEEYYTEITDIITKIDHLDIQLYDFAKSIFNKRMRILSSRNNT